MDKLQRAGRDFPIRLVAKHGLAGAARVLCVLAEELDIDARRSVKCLDRRWEVT
jgi:hypothetical protein